MKTLGISALVATLVAIPLLWKRRSAIAVSLRDREPSTAENLKYDINDLLT